VTTRLLIIRHGETEWNREERFRGRADLGLTPKGRAQAEALARRLSSWDIAAVYSSPLRRARQTADIIARSKGLEARILEDLIDIDYGQWQGLSPEEAAARDGGLFCLWSSAPHRVKFPGGESLDDVRERATRALAYIRDRHPGETIAAVSHVVVCRVLILALLEWDNSHFWKIRQDLTALNLFELRERFNVALVINDVCHLRDAGLPGA